MAEPAARIDQTPEWQALRKHHQELKDRPLRELFAADPSRGETMTCEAGDLYLDYSKQRVTGETLGLLVALAERAGLRGRIDAMFAGQRINVTEDRSVLHTALRAPEGSQILLDGHNVVEDVHEVLGRGGPALRCGNAGPAPAAHGQFALRNCSCEWSYSRHTQHSRLRDRGRGIF